jgi:hypothetical protein
MAEGWDTREVGKPRILLSIPPIVCNTACPDRAILVEEEDVVLARCKVKEWREVC